MRARLLVIGIGNELAGDDAVGLAAAGRIRASRPDGVEVVEAQREPTALIDHWTPEDSVVLVDAMRSGAQPGTIRRFDVTRDPLPDSLDSVSTHSLALGVTIELARQLGRMPARMVVYAVEGRQFGIGRSMSPECEVALDALAQAVLTERPQVGSVLFRSD